MGVAMKPIRNACHPSCCWAMSASRISVEGHKKAGAFPYKSISHEQILATRIGTREGSVSSCVSHTSNSTRRSLVNVLVRVRAC